MKRMKKKCISKQRMIVFILFAIYVAFMLYELFLQRIRRDISVPYTEYIKSSVNMIPFKTIINYAADVKNSTRLASWAFINLSGNIVLFIPLGIFFPTIWRKQRKLSKFVITVCIVIIAVELIQLFCMLGSCDIDDLIFNVIGAVIGFGIWNFKPVLKLLHKYRFL